jgi:hypothetical protein
MQTKQHLNRYQYWLLSITSLLICGSVPDSCKLELWTLIDSCPVRCQDDWLHNLLLSWKKKASEKSASEKSQQIQSQSPIQIQIQFNSILESALRECREKHSCWTVLPGAVSGPRGTSTIFSTCTRRAARTSRARTYINKNGPLSKRLDHTMENS